VLLARPVGDGTTVTGAVVLRVSVRLAARDVAQDWTAVMVGALLALVVFVLLALVLSRWVLRPLGELARGIQAIAVGTRSTQVESRTGPRELRALAESFNRMSEAVGAAADQQSRLISDASHQLRNPMAALRLRVDSLAGSLVPAGEGAYRSVVGEVERLASLLDGLLALASAEHTATLVVADAFERDGHGPCCLPAVVLLDRVDAWSPAAAEASVELVPGQLDPACTAGCPEGDLAQILDVLLDNAIKYAGPGTTVGLTCGRLGDDVRLTIADDGPGLSAPERALATTRFWRSAGQHVRGSGLGLAIADQLVTAWSGRLQLTAGEPTGLVVTVDLPRQREQ
jgi:signal transduction histidine kinase